MARHIPVTYEEKVQEREAVKTGRLDAILAAVFSVGGVAVAELLGWLITLLPMLDTFQAGKYRWLTVPLGIILGAIVKGLDRKKHEDPSPSTGLVRL